MRRTFTLLTACAAAGCAASTASPSPEGAERYVLAADSVRRGHAAVDLSGAWATGGVGEPAAQRIVLRVQCNYSPPQWVIDQRGDTARVWAMPASYSQGVPTPQHVSTIPGEGLVSGVELTLGTAGARYVLHYDSTSGHLRGTLNGAPFWAVRLDVARPDHCVAVP
jgi:hypothetical protein